MRTPFIGGALAAAVTVLVVLTPANPAGAAATPPGDLLSRVRTNAVADATPTGRRHGLPLAVLGFRS
ncbi:hypothetical protein [Sphaerisporangium fuscum]|uniref:hypothetical protein n=1 Tax=Sphaerisporangium fuscum TaxID=2835868 RepID=UPI001BDD9A31|nr:hypothetical protein [Sphaerisporangium fuscum]